MKIFQGSGSVGAIISDEEAALFDSTLSTEIYKSIDIKKGDAQTLREVSKFGRTGRYAGQFVFLHNVARNPDALPFGP